MSFGTLGFGKLSSKRGLPTLPPGYAYVVFSDGSYATDASGNYYIMVI